MRQKRLAALLFAMLLPVSLAACASSDAKELSAKTNDKNRGYLEGSADICLFENDSCSFTLRNALPNDADGYRWEVSMTNKTASKLTFSMDEVYVNGFEADPYWADDVVANQSEDSTVSWFHSTFDECGITVPSRVDFQLTVYPSNDSEALLANQRITLYPNGKDAYQSESRKILGSDEVLIDTEQLQFIVTSTLTDAEDGFRMNLYLENRTEETLLLTMENVKVNGQRSDPYWTRTLIGGTKSFSFVNWYNEALEKMEIQAVSRVEFNLVVTDSKGSTLIDQHCAVQPKSE